MKAWRTRLLASWLLLITASGAEAQGPAVEGDAGTGTADSGSAPDGGNEAQAGPDQGVASPSGQVENPGEAPAQPFSTEPGAPPVYPQGYTPPDPGVTRDVYQPGPDEPSLEGVPGAREHDGFFLRLSIGPGAGRAHYKERLEDDDRISTIEASGLAGMFDVAVGARVVGNLIVHGNLMFSRFDSPTRRVEGVKDASLHVTSSTSMLGAGVSYYFMPYNVYVSGSLGMAWAFERRQNDQLRSGTGVFVGISAGKEWWVGRDGDWGLGAALKTTFMAAPFDIAGVESTLKLGNIGVAFSATFN